MGSEGAGYDLLTSQFSPDGRIFQVEYAQKAVGNSRTVIGMRGKDGVVFAVDNSTPTLHEKSQNRTFTIDDHIGAVTAGLAADARHLINTARIEASNFRTEYHTPIPLSYIKNRLSAYVHTYTLYSGIRPFGASIIIGAYDPDRPQMYCIDPSGTAWGYFGCAIGKESQAAKSEMENINFEETPIMVLVKKAARTLYTIQDDVEDFEIELSWVGKVTDGKHKVVPQWVQENAENYAKETNDSDSDDEYIHYI